MDRAKACLHTFIEKTVPKIRKGRFKVSTRVLQGRGRFPGVAERRPEKKNDGGNASHTESPLENPSETVLAPRLRSSDLLQPKTTEKRGKVSRKQQISVWYGKNTLKHIPNIVVHWLSVPV